jgi:sentrin-specific protease 1
MKNVFRWSKNFNIFHLNRVYIPINIGQSHWTLIVIYIESKKICYFDSYGHTEEQRYLTASHDFLRDEWEKNYGGVKFEDTWEIVGSPDWLPQQHSNKQNNTCCGVFVCAFADLLTDDIPLTNFSINEVPHFRNKICLNILHKKICYDRLVCKRYLISIFIILTIFPL